MSTLWPRNKPLVQPPHFGRIGMQPEHAKPCPITADAQRAVAESQFKRQDVTKRLGQRAVVRG